MNKNMNKSMNVSRETLSILDRLSKLNKYANSNHNNNNDNNNNDDNNNTLTQINNVQPYHIEILKNKVDTQAALIAQLRAHVFELKQELNISHQSLQYERDDRERERELFQTQLSERDMECKKLEEKLEYYKSLSTNKNHSRVNHHNMHDVGNKRSFASTTDEIRRIAITKPKKAKIIAINKQTSKVPEKPVVSDVSHEEIRKYLQDDQW